LLLPVHAARFTRAPTLRGTASLLLPVHATRFTRAPIPFPRAGIPIKWTTTGFIPPGSLPNTSPIPPAITRHTALVHDLCGKAQASSRRILGAEGDLTLMRLHTSAKEYIIAPAEHETLLIVQKSHSAALVELTKAADAEQAASLAAGAKKGEEGKKK
jgi:hypothetical protein